jgi:hypothetical protein
MENIALLFPAPSSSFHYGTTFKAASFEDLEINLEEVFNFRAF